MYKGLKPELEDIVKNLKPGDEVVLRFHFPKGYYEFPQRAGYVKEITDSYISLKMKWDLDGRIERLVHRILRTEPRHKDVVEYSYEKYDRN